MEEGFEKKCFVEKKNNNNIIRLNLYEIYNNQSNTTKYINQKKKLNKSITESDSDTDFKINQIKNYDIKNKKRKKVKWTKAEKKLFVESFFKFRNNFTKIRRNMKKKSMTNIYINVRRYLNKIRKLIGKSNDENYIKLKVEELFKNELKEKYDNTYLPNFILFIMEYVLLNRKKNKKKIINNIGIKDELTTETTVNLKSKKIYIQKKFIENSHSIDKLISQNKDKTVNVNCINQSNDKSNVNINNNENINAMNKNNNIENINNINEINNHSEKNLEKIPINMDFLNDDLENNKIFDFDNSIYHSSYYDDNELFEQKIFGLNE